MVNLLFTILVIVEAVIVSGLESQNRIANEIPRRVLATADGSQYFSNNYVMECDVDAMRFSKGYEKHYGNAMTFGKFLVIHRLYEQLSKSRKHFAEILKIARVTKRVLVLPHCQDGHIGNGLYFWRPICIYFDVEKIGNSVDWVTEKFFLERIAEFRLKKISPSVRAVYFSSSDYLCNPEELFTGKMPQQFWISSNNLTMAVLDNRPFICTNNCPVKEENPSPLSLVQDSLDNSSDILVIGKATPHPCIDYEDQLKYLVPPPKLWKFVNKFIEDRLTTRYVAVQWRMEWSVRKRTSNKQMEKCAEGLVSTVKKVKSDFGLSGVFVATDFSPDNISLSYTLWFKKEKRDLLLKLVKFVHGELSPSTLKDFYPSILETDPGVWGLIEKMICSKATVFFYAPPSCFGETEEKFVPSSYTREILTSRKQDQIPEDRTSFWSVVD